jgi:hypothetical protein
MPTGWWWHIHAATLNASGTSRTMHLCSVCVTILEKWLRNDPPHTHPGELDTAETPVPLQ